MLIRIKKNSVTVEGYVNVVERDSEVLYDGRESFIERIKQGAFGKSLKRRENVRVLLNHDEDRELATTADGTATLKEDNIGLWCRTKIKDEEVIQLAREKRLIGWSFGFLALNDRDLWTDDNVRHREVLDLDLREVSILDDTKMPAYPANSISTRELENGEHEEVEFRSIEDGVETREEKESDPESGVSDKTVEETEAGDPADNHQFRNRAARARITKRK